MVNDGLVVMDGTPTSSHRKKDLTTQLQKWSMAIFSKDTWTVFEKFIYCILNSQIG